MHSEGWESEPMLYREDVFWFNRVYFRFQRTEESRHRRGQTQGVLLSLLFPAGEASAHRTEETGQGEECSELLVLCHFKLMGGAMMCKGLSPHPMWKMYIGWRCEGHGNVQ